MHYVIFTMDGKSGQPLPLDFFLPPGGMGTRTITWQQPQQKQAEQSSTGSWAGTLFKAALIGTALAGAAYAGYRFGFFDGAAGMFDTMKEHFQNPASQPSGFETNVDSAEMPGTELGTGASALAKAASGSASSLQNSVDFESMKQYFMGEAAKRNPLMNANPLNLNTTAIGETVSGFMQSAKGSLPDPVALYSNFKNDLFWGAITVATTTTSVLIGVAKCLGAVRGLYR